MKAKSSDRRGTYAFGAFRLSADGTLLLRDGVAVPLAPKVLQTLRILVERAGDVVTKADMLDAVWPDCFVEETGLSRNISLLRQALDDSKQTIIVTVARVGYRFAMPVAFDGPAAAGVTTEAAGAPVEAAAPGASVSRRRLLVLPFRLLRDDPETAFLAFSVPDAVVHALSGLSSLVVRSSDAASRFMAEPLDLQRISAEAGVDALVRGTLLRAGSRIRMSAQLLDLPSGTVLWTRSIEAPVGDVFALQDHLVNHIVRSLPVSLTPTERRRLTRDVPASPLAYELFLRGNEALGPQGIISSANLRVARGLYLQAVLEDPRFAPAWARLGRCHYLIGKTDQHDAAGESPAQCLALADSCFARALEISPDLPLAHSLYALVEIDRGRARDAMVRLVGQALGGGATPELFAALTQACRYCGLLEASVAAHYRARALDPAIPTSGYQSIWHLGDNDGALREGIRPLLLTAIVTGMNGDRARALELLRDLESRGPTHLLRCLTGCIRAVFEDRHESALEHARPIFDSHPDPEAWYFVGRTIAYFGDPRAIVEFSRSLDGGYVVYRVMLRLDPWLDPIRRHPGFTRLVERARQTYVECRKAYLDAGGEHLLGAVPSPEELERNPDPGGARWRHASS